MDFRASCYPAPAMTATDTTSPFQTPIFRNVWIASLASNFGGWGASLWAMLAFAACAALCGYAVLRIEAR